MSQQTFPARYGDAAIQLWYRAYPEELVKQHLNPRSRTSFID
jgi:hypothetical protein